MSNTRDTQSAAGGNKPESISNMLEDPSARPTTTREFGIVCILYVGITLLYLWPALLPWTIHKLYQTRDSVLAATIAAHTSRSIFFNWSEFWNVPFFYPITDTLCLSEPMITQAVLMTPFIRLFGAGTASNLWIYFCWFSTATAAWAFLRSRGTDPLSAFWGGFAVSFTPDRLWHLAGHTHLYYQAGFALTLLGLDRALQPKSSRWWAAAAGVGLLTQVCAGFYISAIFAVWIVFTGSAIMLENRARVPRFLRRHGLQLAAWCTAVLLIMAPVALHYTAYGRQTPQNSLETVQAGAADWKGYVVPPAEAGRAVTLPGKFFPPEARMENSQYIGAAVMGAAFVGMLFIGVQLAGRRRFTSSLLFPLGLCAAGATALVLSFGPWLYPDFSKTTRLPFAHIYAWFEPIRFFRAPARFAFAVQWSAVFLAVIGMVQARRLLMERGRTQTARVLQAAVVVFSFCEFFPTDKLYQVSMAESELTRFQAAEPGNKPYVYLPADHDVLVQLGHNFEPTSNGYSGYSPPLREQELAFLTYDFPSTASQMLLSRWGVSRVFVSNRMRERQRNAARIHSGLKYVWESPEGVLYEAADPPLRFADFLRDLRRRTGAAGPHNPIIIAEGGKFDASRFAASRDCRVLPPGEGRPRTRFLYLAPGAHFEINFRDSPLQPAVYTVLTMRVKIRNWYDLNEPAAIRWSTAGAPGYGERRTYNFMAPADGEFHDIRLVPGEQIAWLCEEPITRIRLELGSRIHNEVEIESLRFESSDAIRWELNPAPHI